MIRLLTLRGASLVTVVGLVGALSAGCPNNSTTTPRKTDKSGVDSTETSSKVEATQGEKTMGPTAAPSSPDSFVGPRKRMVEVQLAGRDIRDERVLEAMRRVPRHEFVPARFLANAYQDRPLPIGNGQTISQPYIVACMTELAKVEPGSRVLEVGTGSGYQAAVLAEMGATVYTIEIVEELAADAKRDLTETGYIERVHTRVGDGYRGWPKEAPFDAILVTAAPDHIPEPLIEQLAVGGRMVIPVGDFHQELMVVEKSADGVVRKSVLPVRFVPMTGEALKGAPAE